MAEQSKIVIADDNREMCELVADILGETGYAVDAVYNGYELLAYLEDHNPSVIILDLMMPEKNGLDIFDTLRQVSPYSRIIIYTGYQDYENTPYARAADKFLVKGRSIEELVEAVKEFV